MLSALGADLPGTDDTREARLETAVRQRAAVVALELADAGLADTPGAHFWQGQAFLLGGRVAQADGEFARLAEKVDGPFFGEAVFSRVALWTQQGDFQRALEVLQPAFSSANRTWTDRARLAAAELNLNLAKPAAVAGLVAAVPAGPEKELLLARAALAQQDVAQALQIISPVSAKVPAGPKARRLRWAARLLEARAKAAAGQSTEAANVVVEMIRAEPDAPEVTPAILVLEEIGALALPEVTNSFPEWLAGTSAPTRVPAAQFGMAAAAAAASQWPLAVAEWRKFLEKWSDHPLAGLARRRLAEAHLAAGALPEARTAAAAWHEVAASRAERAEAAFLRARIETAARDHTAAATFFDEAARVTPDPEAAAAALSDGAWAAIDGQLPDVDRWLQALSTRPEKRLRVLAERGFYEADRKRPEAALSFEAYLAAAGETAGNTAEIHTALAELAMLQTPPATAAARQHLRAARRSSPKAATAQRLDWISLWIEENDGQLEEAMKQARVFVQDWPDSAWRPAVHAKIAAWLGRLGQWPAAVDEYRAFAEAEDTDPAAAARALYLAGLAELSIASPESLDRAIDHWSAAAEADDSMNFPARFQQALAKSRLGKGDEALRLLDDLLKGTPALTPIQKNVVLSARGELFLRPSPAGETSPDQALTSFHEVGNDPATPSPLRRQATCRRADCLRLLGRPDEALTAYREAAAPLLENPLEALDEDEASWAARAAFSAISVLQERSDWAGAVRLATQLARSNGPHAAKAADLANRLRLEHFLWEK